MATGNYRDPIAERASEEGDSSNSDSNHREESTSEATSEATAGAFQRTKLNSMTLDFIHKFQTFKVLNGLFYWA